MKWVLLNLAVLLFVTKVQACNNTATCDFADVCTYNNALHGDTFLPNTTTTTGSTCLEYLRDRMNSTTYETARSLSSGSLTRPEFLSTCCSGTTSAPMDCVCGPGSTFVGSKTFGTESVTCNYKWETAQGNQCSARKDSFRLEFQTAQLITSLMSCCSTPSEIDYGLLDCMCKQEHPDATRKQTANQDPVWYNSYQATKCYDLFATVVTDHAPHTSFSGISDQATCSSFMSTHMIASHCTHGLGVKSSTCGQSTKQLECKASKYDDVDTCRVYEVSTIRDCYWSNPDSACLPSFPPGRGSVPPQGFNPEACAASNSSETCTDLTTFPVEQETVCYHTEDFTGVCTGKNSTECIATEVPIKKDCIWESQIGDIVSDACCDVPYSTLPLSTQWCQDAGKDIYVSDGRVSAATHNSTPSCDDITTYDTYENMLVTPSVAQFVEGAVTNCCRDTPAPTMLPTPEPTLQPTDPPTDTSAPTASSAPTPSIVINAGSRNKAAPTCVAFNAFLSSIGLLYLA